MDEQYPPANEKYKLLEKRLKAMEIQKDPRLNFEELGLVSGVVIPPSSKLIPSLSMMVFLARSCI